MKPILSLLLSIYLSFSELKAQEWKVDTVYVGEKGFVVEYKTKIRELSSKKVIRQTRRDSLYFVRQKEKIGRMMNDYKQAQEDKKADKWIIGGAILSLLLAIRLW